MSAILNQSSLHFSLQWLSEVITSVIESTSSELGIAGIISSLIFMGVFIAISTRLLHETAAALLGAVLVFLVTYIGGTFYSELQLLTFDEAMTFIDWNVIFLIMGMMIIMAILSSTNIFRWIAFHLYRIARGNTWLIVLFLVSLTGLTSALLNNVTSILLIVPLSIQLAVIIGFNPLAIVIAEVLASNIGGAATLIGDPPSTIVGSHIGASFGFYLVNLAPVAIFCMIALLIMNRIQYRKEYAGGKKKISSSLVEKLESESYIEDYQTLNKALIVSGLTFVMFLLADYFGQMPPSVVALGGAAVLIAWVRPDMKSMLHEVDWTTLIFFIGLFILVGAMEATGAIDWAASYILTFAGDSLEQATLLVVWVSGIASGIVDNIPFTVAALPVVDLLTANIPGAAESNVLYWALILGADFGGNTTYLGSAPNIIAVGLLAQAGYRCSFGRFMRDGVPVTFVTLVIASIYLLLRYL
jgi:Na+/H+ antiporter NhaD/arsenite permease-like protein